MKKLLALTALIFILAIAGCTQKSAEQSGNVTVQKSEKSEKPFFGKPAADFASEIVVLENLNKSDYVRLFLGLYPDVKPVLSKQQSPPAWVASYVHGTKNLTLSLNATSAEVVSSTIALDYLKSGKYCNVDADCINIGSSSSALCINSVYANQEGISKGAATCYAGFEYCGCSINYCLKKTVSPNTALCASSSNTSASTSASNPLSSGSSVACNSITELKVGQKATSGTATLKFVSSFDDSGQYGAKISVTSENESSTKYLRVNAKDYIAAGVTVLVKDVIIEVGSGDAVVSLSITGMAGTCVIS